MSERILTPDLCVIGAGSGGLSVASGAVQMGAICVICDRHCLKALNTFCKLSDLYEVDPEDVAEFVEYSEFLRETNERQKEFMERGAMINNM